MPASSAPPTRLPTTVGALIVGLVATIVGGSPASGIDASRGQAGFCPTDRGVTVVIDFQDLGGDTIVRCADDIHDGTGLDALKAAGIQIDGTQRWGEGFVCRIEDTPSATLALSVPGSDDYREACVDTPPATAYWSYWHAGNGCRWEYSQWGVKNRSFIPGGFEGWAFSLNADPGATPQPRIDPVRPGTEEEGCDPAEGAPSSTQPSDDRSPTSAVAEDDDAAVVPADGAFTGGDDRPDVRDAQREASGGSPAAAIAAIAALGGLALGTWWVRRRRRRSIDEP